MEGLNNPGLERKSFDYWLWCCHFTSKSFNDSESMKGGLRIINETTHVKAWCLAHGRCEEHGEGRDLGLETSTGNTYQELYSEVGSLCFWNSLLLGIYPNEIIQVEEKAM